MKKRYWHFVAENKRLGYDDRRPVKPGRIYKVDCDPILCESGLHASAKPLDALKYSPGPIICRVELGGKIVHWYDKSVATERKVFWMADATETLREFARWCALSVIHLWDAPEIVVEYLKTGDEKLRAAALAAARSAALAARTALAVQAVQAAAWSALAILAVQDAARTALAVQAVQDAALAARTALAVQAAARSAQNKKLGKLLLSLKP